MYRLLRLVNGGGNLCGRLRLGTVVVAPGGITHNAGVCYRMVPASSSMLIHVRVLLHVVTSLLPSRHLLPMARGSTQCKLGVALTVN